MCSAATLTAHAWCRRGSITAYLDRFGFRSPLLKAMYAATGAVKLVFTCAMSSLCHVYGSVISVAIFLPIKQL